MDMHTRKIRVALLSVGSNTTLVIGKVLVGLMIGSVSVLSEALHSATDLLAALIAWFAVRSAARPEDEVHPFGHGKFENLSGVIEALLIFAAAGWISFEAIRRLLDPQPLEQVGWGVLIMLLSAVINIFVSALLFKVARETDSVALEADAWHLRTDVWTSAGVMVGLGLIWLGDRFLAGVDLHWIDPVAALAVALLILRAAWRLTLQAGRDLLDTCLPPEEEEWLRDYLQENTASVGGFHRLRTRKGGATRFISFHLLVDPDMHVHDSHELADHLAAGIMQRFPGARVFVHVEPLDPSGSASAPGSSA